MLLVIVHLNSLDDLAVSSIDKQATLVKYVQQNSTVFGGIGFPPFNESMFEIVLAIELVAFVIFNFVIIVLLIEVSKFSSNKSQCRNHCNII